MHCVGWATNEVGMTLHAYFWARFTRNLFFMGFVFLCLIFVVELESEFTNLYGDETTFGDVVVLALLRLPGELYDLLPLIFLLASVATFFRLVIDYEMVAVRANGRSGYTTAISMAVFTIICGLGIIALIGPLVSWSEEYYHFLADRSGSQTNQLFISNDGQVWLRLIIDGRQTVIRAKETDAGVIFRDVTVHSFDREYRPHLRHDAAMAEMDESRLRLHDVKTWDFGGDTNVEAGARTLDEVILETNTNRDGILQLLQPPNHKSVWVLRELIQNLEKSGFSSINHRIYFNSELVLPLTLSFMTILGSLVFQDPSRRLQVITSILGILIVGIGAYFLIDIVSVLGEYEVLPVVISTWALPISLLFFSVAVLLLLEGR